jgi:hypothetical protein
MLLADYDAKFDACRWKYSHDVVDAVLVVNI